MRFPDNVFCSTFIIECYFKGTISLLKLFYSLNEILILKTTNDTWHIQHMDQTYKLIISILRVFATLIYQIINYPTQQTLSFLILFLFSNSISCLILRAITSKIAIQIIHKPASHACFFRFPELASINSTSVLYTREYLIKQMTPIKQPTHQLQIGTGT